MRVLALLACVVVGLVIALVVLTGPSKADTADFEGLVQSITQAGVPLAQSRILTEDKTTIAEFVVQSGTATDTAKPEDVDVKEQVARQAALYKSKGLKIDQLSFKLLNTSGKLIYEMRIPLDKGIDPSWYSQPTQSDDALQTKAKDALAVVVDVSSLQIDKFVVGVGSDGAQVIDIHLTAQDPKAQNAVLRKLMMDYRWVIDDLNKTDGTKYGLIRIDVVDGAGQPVARYTADLQLQHDTSWMAPGLDYPGSSRARPTTGATTTTDQSDSTAGN